METWLKTNDMNPNPNEINDWKQTNKTPNHLKQHKNKIKTKQTEIQKRQECIYLNAIFKINKKIIKYTHTSKNVF